MGGDINTRVNSRVNNRTWINVWVVECTNSCYIKVDFKHMHIYTSRSNAFDGNVILRHRNLSFPGMKKRKNAFCEIRVFLFKKKDVCTLLFISLFGVLLAISFLAKLRRYFPESSYNNRDSWISAVSSEKHSDMILLAYVRIYTVGLCAISASLILRKLDN